MRTPWRLSNTVSRTWKGCTPASSASSGTAKPWKTAGPCATTAWRTKTPCTWSSTSLGAAARLLQMSATRVGLAVHNNPQPCMASQALLRQGAHAELDEHLYAACKRRLVHAAMPTPGASCCQADHTRALTRLPPPSGAMTKLSFSYGGPHWRICSPGLNMEGICATASCEDKKMIIDQKVSHAVPSHLQRRCLQ